MGYIFLLSRKNYSVSLLFLYCFGGWFSVKAQTSFQNFFVKNSQYLLETTLSVQPYSRDSLWVVAGFPLADSLKLLPDEQRIALHLTVYLQSNNKHPFREYSFSFNQYVGAESIGGNWGSVASKIPIPPEYFTIESELTILKLKGYNRFYSAHPASFRWNISAVTSQNQPLSFYNDSIRIDNSGKQVLVDEYMIINKLPNPPYSVFRRKNIVLQPTIHNKVLPTPIKYFPNNAGGVILKNSTADTLNCLLFFGNADFPEPTTLFGLINPLGYICSSSEMRYFREDPSKRKLDEFWLDVGGNAARARERISIFYEQVAMSNRLFTDFRPGYLTDRGMIRCVFGRSDAIIYQPNKEIWIYEAIPGQTNSTKFTFIRYPHQLTANYFELVRDPSYETLWFQTINNLRNGIIKK